MSSSTSPFPPSRRSLDGLDGDPTNLFRLNQNIPPER